MEVQPESVYILDSRHQYKTALCRKQRYRYDTAETYCRDTLKSTGKGSARKQQSITPLSTLPYEHAVRYERSYCIKFRWSFQICSRSCCFFITISFSLGGMSSGIRDNLSGRPVDTSSGNWPTGKGLFAITMPVHTPVALSATSRVNNTARLQAATYKRFYIGTRFNVFMLSALS
jgi:hypothetical protein